MSAGSQVTSSAEGLRVELRLRVDGAWEPAEEWLLRIDELLERYLSDEHLTCCSMHGGFFIEIDGRIWSDDATVDEFWMTQGWLRGLDAIVHGSQEAACSPGPWEESNLRLSRAGTDLVMEDIHHSGNVSMPRVTVNLRAFVAAMMVEAEKFCRLLEQLSTAAGKMTAHGDQRRHLDQVLRATRIEPDLAERVRRWTSDLRALQG